MCVVVCMCVKILLHERQLQFLQSLIVSLPPLLPPPYMKPLSLDLGREDKQWVINPPPPQIKHPPMPYHL